MSGPARILIQVISGDTVVHEFRRATTQPTTDGLRKMLDTGLGWLQSYGAQVTDDQWQMDVERARIAQYPHATLPEDPHDIPGIETA